MRARRFFRRIATARLVEMRVVFFKFQKKNTLKNRWLGKQQLHLPTNKRFGKWRAYKFLENQ